MAIESIYQDSKISHLLQQTARGEIFFLFILVIFDMWFNSWNMYILLTTRLLCQNWKCVDWEDMVNLFEN